MLHIFFIKASFRKNNPKTEIAAKEDEPKENIFLLTEEEKEHLTYLDKTYRDRAKERREAEADNIEEEYLNPDPNLFEDEDENGMPKGGLKKGLDFDLLKREREKAEEEMMEKSLEQKKEVISS